MELGFEPGSRIRALNRPAHSRSSISSLLLGRVEGELQTSYPHFPQVPPRTRPRPALPAPGSGPSFPAGAEPARDPGGCGLQRRWQRLRGRGRGRGRGGGRGQSRSEFGGGNSAGNDPLEVTPSEGAHPAPHLCVPSGLGRGGGGGRRRDRGLGEAPWEQRRAAGDASTLAPTQLGSSENVNGTRAAPRAPLGTGDGTIW